ncbi:DNA-directed primase/polymerase protein [Pseudoscourfieldia marina]
MAAPAPTQHGTVPVSAPAPSNDSSFYGASSGSASSKSWATHRMMDYDDVIENLRIIKKRRRLARSSYLEARAHEYREFPRLDLAKAYAAHLKWKPTQTGRAHANNQDDSQELKLFARQTPEDGTRRFAAATRRGACERAMAEPPERRHFYELLESDEGDAQAQLRSQCHAFLDVEFARDERSARVGEPCADDVGDRLVDDVVRRMQAHAQRTLGCQFARVYELDSSTTTKFSRHLIMQLPAPRMFRSARHVGPFVREALATNSEPSLVAPEPSADAGKSIVDMGVYTRNRMFRTCFSRKFGKNKAPLALTRRFDGPGLLASADTARRTPAHMHLLGGVADAATSTTPDAGDCLVWLELLASRGRLDPDPIAPPLEQHQHQHQHQQHHSNGGNGGGPPKASGYATMPFPDVEAFLLEVCRRKAPQSSPRVRSWALFADNDARRDMLVVNIDGHRYCENICRQHKSNGVYYVVDWRIDAFAQRCYDADCRGFRAPAMPLPESLRRGGCSEPNPSRECWDSEEAALPPRRAADLAAASDAPQPKRYRLVAPSRFVARSD